MCYSDKHGMWTRGLLLQQADVYRAQMNLPSSLTTDQKKLEAWNNAKRLKHTAGEKKPLEFEWKILEGGAWSCQIGQILDREIHLLVEELTDIDYRWSATESMSENSLIATLVSPAFRYGRLWIALQAAEMWYTFIVGNYHPDDALQLTLKLTHPSRYQKGAFTSLESIYEKEEEMYGPER